ncbi:MAG: uracil-DNA glycosylase [Candidatus Aminicenantes bacterium]|nr:uracil-DNA glycosylase [Candidatus Aminicenantes bacterium]
MEKRTEKILSDLEESIKFFSELGIASLSADKPGPSIEERILRCRLCPLSASRTKAVPGEGSGDADLMFVGEAPGRDEDLQGKPFVGKAGQLLTKILKAMNFERHDVYITNVVKCRPPNNREPNAEEMEQCKGYLMEQIEQIAPKVIVTLGNVPTHFFIPSKKGVTALRGDFYPYNDILVMPTFHPSYLVRNEGNRLLRKNVWEDMKKVMAFLGKQ